MCGIAGVWGEPDEALVRSMLDALVHRGPDAAGVHTTPGGMLGHRRLSIVDVEGGNQPILDETGDRAIAANGEIYNFPLLRRRLAPHHTFRTRSDTETALHLYADLGGAMVRHLDGMFALAIADGPDLFLARDPIGIKPLYLGWKSGQLVFASELKALAGRVDEVSEFPPGSYYHSQLGLRTYYMVPQRPARPLTVETAARIVRLTLDRAVTKRLMADVPVGAFLSGGLDSSLVAALARPHVDRLHTFAVGLEGSPDLEAARRVAAYLDTDHHEHVFTPQDVRAALPAILYHLESYDQDLVRSAVPCYFAARLAAGHVKVILTGEGADELFAGYAYHRAIASPDALHAELARSITALHNVNLQRVDRLTMACSIEGRVPFLDVAMVEACQGLAPELKLRRQNGRLVEKWILRVAGQGLLPDDILWREKEQFDEGTGAAELLPELAGELMTAGCAARYTKLHRSARLRSREECVYHDLLSRAFDDPRLVLKSVARWSDRPAGIRDAVAGRSPNP